MSDKVTDYYDRLPDHLKEIAALAKQGRLKVETPRQRLKNPYPFDNGRFVFVGTSMEFDSYLKRMRELASCQSGDNDQCNWLAESTPGYTEVGVDSVAGAD